MRVNELAHHSPPLRLVIRLQPFNGEAWQGYLLRLAEENGLPGYRSIEKLLQLKFGQLRRGAQKGYFEHLSIDNATVETANCGTSPRLAMAHKVCDTCWSQRQFVRAQWELPLYWICLEHKVRLTTTCQFCEQPFWYTRKSLSFCSCGRSIGLSSKRETSPNLIAAQDLFGSCHQRPFGLASIPSEHLQAMGAIGRLLSTPLKLSNVNLPKQEAAIEQLFEDFPRKFQAAIRSKLDGLSGRNRSWAVRNLKLAAPPFMVDAVEGVLLDIENAVRRVPGVGGKSVKLIDGCLSLAEAVRLTQASLLTVEEWKVQGWVKTIRAYDGASTRGRYLVSYEAIEAFEAAKGDTYGLRELAALYSLTTKHVVRLALAGFINPVGGHKSNHEMRFNKTALGTLSALCNEARSCDRLDRDNEVQVNELWVFQLNSNWTHPLRLVMAGIASGAVPLYCMQGSRSGLGEMTISRQGLAAYMRSLRFRNCRS